MKFASCFMTITVSSIAKLFIIALLLIGCVFLFDRNLGDVVFAKYEVSSINSIATDTVLPAGDESSQPLTSAADTLPPAGDESFQLLTSATDTLPPAAGEPLQLLTSATDTLPPAGDEPSQLLTSATDTLPPAGDESSQLLTSATDTLPPAADEPSQLLTPATDTLPPAGNESSQLLTSATDTLPPAAGESSQLLTSATDTLPPAGDESSQLLTPATDTSPLKEFSPDPTDLVNTDVSAGDHNSLLYMVWKEEPRFGGMWVDTSEGMEVLHILLTGGEEGSTTATVNAHRAVAKIFGRSFDSVAYEKADYTIGELIEWHTALRERVWEIPEVIALDLDERENGLRIGVRDLAAANDKVPNLVHDLRIPVEAISVYEGESVVIPPLEPVSPDLPPR